MVRRLAKWGSMAAFLALIGCRVTDIPIWDAPNAKLPEACEISDCGDLPYYKGDDADRFRHDLRLFVPKGKTDFPVIVLVHGGAWMVGDNNCCGLYTSVGQYFASRGIGVAMPNYRLSPAVKHPEHVKDVARAVAWVRTNIKRFGGNPDELYLMGHSAGGHLVSLLATDEQYLKAEGMSAENIKGVIAISGVYKISPGPVSVTLGGEGPLAFRIDKIAPLRGDNLPRWANFGQTNGIPVTVDIYSPAFSDDPKVREAASPITHVAGGLPPFLIFTAENDLPTLGELAEDFHQELQRVGGSSRLVTVKNCNHNSIMFQAIEPENAVVRETMRFVRNR